MVRLIQQLSRHTCHIKCLTEREEMFVQHFKFGGRNEEKDGLHFSFAG